MHVSSALYQLDICEDHASFYDFKTSRYSIKKPCSISQVLCLHLLHRVTYCKL